MEIYKRIVVLSLFYVFCLASISSEDTVKHKRHIFFLSSGFSYFNINDKKDRKYYSGEYGGGYISGGYERKYFITELKYQYGKSKDATYHFGEWNFGVKFDFLKQHRIALMTGLYAYRTQEPISTIIKNLPLYKLLYSNYGNHPILYHYNRDTAFSFYQGSSNFMEMDISNGKFKFVGTNLMTMILMHLKLEYNVSINHNLSLSLSGSTYFSNAIDEFISLNDYKYYYYDIRTSYMFQNPKYILNSCSNLPLTIVFEQYNKTLTYSEIYNYPLIKYVPPSILFNINVGVCYKF
jgi:hypothetical protein